MGINRVGISGNLTRDPELRASTQGGSVLQFCVAVNDRRKVGDEWKDIPNFVDCIVFGKRADALAPKLSKGTKVCVDGKLRYSSWEDKDGRKRSKLEVSVDELEILTYYNEEVPF